MNKYLLTNEEQDFIKSTFYNPSARAKTFYQFGQKYLKSLDDIELQEKTYALFQYILDNKDSWQGEILVPLLYRHPGDLKINSISYPIREFIGWSVLYPKEVDKYFDFNEDGNIMIKENPILRLVEKDKYKVVKKVVKDREVSVKSKKDADTSLKSGYSLSQKEDILNIVIACYVEVDHSKSKVTDKE